MKNIYLIGFMGSGKSSIGKSLGLLLDYRFVDTDSEIEKKYGQMIPSIFEKYGEKTFRTYETEVLKTLELGNIVSTGGGIVESAENMNIMKKSGTVIYLQTTFDEIAKRLESDQSRPLWNKNPHKKKELYRRRNKLYLNCADYIIVTDEKSIEEVAKEIEYFLKSDLHG